VCATDKDVVIELLDWGDVGDTHHPREGALAVPHHFEEGACSLLGVGRIVSAYSWFFLIPPAPVAEIKKII
jgi:hypothetical protein